MTGFGRGCFSDTSRLIWRRGGCTPSCPLSSRSSSPVPSRSASRRRRIWRPPGSIFWRGRTPTRTDRRRLSGFNRRWRKACLSRTRSPWLQRLRPTGRGRGAAPGRRRPGAQDRVGRRGRADPGPGLRAVPRGRRDRHSSPLRAASANDRRGSLRRARSCGTALGDIGRRR